jgi:hypothetical protein
VNGFHLLDDALVGVVDAPVVPLHRMY